MAKYKDQYGRVSEIGNPDLNPQLTQGKTLVPDSTITGATLSSEPAIQIPPRPEDTTNYSGIIAGGQATIDSYLKSLVADTPKQDSLTDMFTKYLGESGVPGAEQDVAANQSSLKLAQDKLSAVNAQLAGITAEAQAIPIRVEKQFEGRASVGDQQAISRAQMSDVALRALPLQAQAIAAQAEVQAAQGNVELSQNTLELAQDKLNTFFQLKTKDAENDYSYKKDIRDKIYDYLTEAEKKIAAAAQTKDNREWEMSKLEFSANKDLAKTAIENGQVELASQFASLDPKSTTYQADKMALVEQLKPDPLDRQIKQAQLAKLQQKKDVKSLTSTQSLALGYGERLLQSSLTIDEVGGQFTGFISRLVGVVPAGLRTQDRQRFEQAKRNFINAVLRRESGAAIAPSEFESADLQYFPQPGDKEDVLIQKKQNRDLVIKNFLREGRVDTSAQDSSLSDPLGIELGDVFSNPLNI